MAGATVMAAASSSPELFINVIGTFVTEGDLGVGTIVGSAVFNILAVPACCAIFANEVKFARLNSQGVVPSCARYLSRTIVVFAGAEPGMVARDTRLAGIRFHGSSPDPDSVGWTCRVARGAHPRRLLCSIYIR